MKFEFQCGLCEKLVDRAHQGYLYIPGSEWRSVWENNRDLDFQIEHYKRSQDTMFPSVPSTMFSEYRKAHWRVAHFDCRPETEDYGYLFNTNRIRTPIEMLDWTAHLLGKGWIRDTDWPDIIRQYIGEVVR